MKHYILLLVVFLIHSVVCEPNVEIEELVEHFQSPLKLADSYVPRNSDAGLNISQYLAKYHYPLESHQVETEDGFFLTLHRIPHGRDQANTTSKTKPAVLLVHGLTCSSMDWVYQGTNSSLALLLADEGYDVWLISTRGTTPSMRHKSLNSTEAAFWDFSFHEKGYYDLPVSVDYITNTTSLQKLTLIGHSEGTTESMVLLTTRPEYNDKVNLVVLLSPIGYMGDLTSPLIIIMVNYMEALKFMFRVFNIHGMPYSPKIAEVGIPLCDDGSPYQEICASFLGLLCGYDFPQLNKTMLTVLMSNTPAGFSVKQLVHYGQEIRSGHFRQYDYGLANLIHYGRTEPPAYNVTKITAPTAAYYAKNDFFAAVTDVQKLIKQLPNVVVDHLVENKLFNHLDFILAKDVKSLLFDDVIANVKKYNPL